jgi:hypothetical protein
MIDLPDWLRDRIDGIDTELHGRLTNRQQSPSLTLTPVSVFG